MNPFATPFPELTTHDKPLYIAGPCSAETKQQTLSTAKELHAYGINIYRAGLWKPRTQPGNFEGVGSKGMSWLKAVQEEVGMQVGTEIATTAHAELALEYGLNYVWIGSRTTTNPFAIEEIIKVLSGSDITILIKNPMNPDINLWDGAIQRFLNAGLNRLAAIHRGFSLYNSYPYRNAPQWHIPIELRRLYPTLPILCDPSHIGGSQQLIAPLSQQALDLDFDGLFIESHISPCEAKSDAQQQVTPSTLHDILTQLTPRTSIEHNEELADLRQQIDSLDTVLIETISERMQIAQEIGKYKIAHNMPIMQKSRYNKLLQNRITTAETLGLDNEFIKQLLEMIHEESIKQQLNLSK